MLSKIGHFGSNIDEINTEKNQSQCKKGSIWFVLRKKKTNYKVRGPNTDEIQELIKKVRELTGL